MNREQPLHATVCVQWLRIQDLRSFYFIIIHDEDDDDDDNAGHKDDDDVELIMTMMIMEVTWEVFMHRQIAPEEFTIGDLN